MSKEITDRIVAIAEELDALAGDLNRNEQKLKKLTKLSYSMLTELRYALGENHPLITIYEQQLKQLKK